MAGDMLGAKPAASNTLVDKAEGLLLGFASGALTGAACLAVVKRQFVRRCQQRNTKVANEDTNPSKEETVVECDEQEALSEGGEGESQSSGSQAAVPIFPAGPLRHASDFFHQIKSARAAAAASVADFKHLVSLQRLEAASRGSAAHLMQEHLQVLEAELMCASSLIEESLASDDHGDGGGDTQRLGGSSSRSSAPVSEAGLLSPTFTGEHGSEEQFEAGQQHPLRQQLAAAEAEAAQSEQQLSELRLQLAAAQQELHMLHSGRAEMQADLAGVQGCITRLAQQLEAAEQRYAAAQLHLQQLHGAVEELLLQLQDAQQQTQHKDMQLLEVTAQLVNIKGQLQDEASNSAQLSQQLMTEEARAEEAVQMLAAAAGGVAAANRQLQHFADAKQHLHTALSALCVQGEGSCEQLHGLISHLVHHVQQQQQQNAEGTQAAAAEHAQQQQRQLQQQQHMQAQLELTRVSMQETASMTQLLEPDLGVLQQQLHSMQAAATAASRLQHVVQQAQAVEQQELAAAQAGLEAQRCAAVEQTQQQQALQTQLDASASQLSEAEQQIEGLQATVNRQFQALQDVEAQLAEARQQLAEKDRRTASPAADADAAVMQMQQRDRQLEVVEAENGAAHETRPEHAHQQACQQSTAAITTSTAVEPTARPEDSSVVVAADLTGSSSRSGAQKGLVGISPARAAGRPAMLLVDNGIYPAAVLRGGSPVAFDHPILNMSILQQQQQQQQAAEEAPTSSLLAELQHESDELAEQLTQLQQYLKTSAPKYGDVHSIGALDEGLQTLRRVADGVVLAATSTVERVSSSSQAAHSAPVSFAGRAPSHAGVLVAQRQKHASCAGTVGLAVTGGAHEHNGPPPAGGMPMSRTVAMRRLGLELPRLESWGSDAALAEHVAQPAEARSPLGAAPLSAGAAATADYDGGCSSTWNRPPSPPSVPTDMLCPAGGVCLENWGSEMSEAACNWLAGDLQVDEELTSFPGTTPAAEPFMALPFTAGVGGVPAAARVPSRLAAVSAAAQAEHNQLAAWGSGAGVWSFSGAGSAAAQEQQQQQQHQATPFGDRTHLPNRQSAVASPTTLQQQLQSALAEVQRLHDERSLLQTQVIRLAELAQQQEDRLAVNTQLLEVLTTGILDDEGLLEEAEGSEAADS